MIHCLIPDLPKAAELMPWLARIDENRWYTNNGPLVRELEQQLCRFIEGCDDGGCVTLSSGMSALELGLQAMGIGPGQRVLLPALTFPATAQAVARCGAVPVLADVCPERWMLTPALARAAITRQRVDLVMPVAAFGMPLPPVEWDTFVEDTGVAVLADAAAALGTQAIGRRVHWAFSMHATKPMGIGEGGLFVSPDRALAEAVRRAANFSFDARVVRSAQATNAKLSEYAAAVGLAQLGRWTHLLACRRTVFERYRIALAELPGVRLQSGSPEAPPATLCVRLPIDAAVVATALGAAGIETRRWYLPPLYEHPAFRDLRRCGPDGRLPITESLATTLLGLPFHTRLADDDVSRVVAALAAQLSRADRR